MERHGDDEQLLLPLQGASRPPPHLVSLYYILLNTYYSLLTTFHFRCKVHRTFHPTTGLPALRFQHPTLAGPGNFGGWFEEKAT